jgi:exopolyphosphatase/guanosine-5'-triphosphate,3'-diphosphate pyrophosphatase
VTPQQSAAPLDPQAQGRLFRRPPVAVIDIGSNSVRLVVYEGATRSPTPLFNEKVLCGLGRSVAATGRLEGEAVARTFEALPRFARIVQQLGAGKPWILATAAVREAENGKAFVEEVERICGGKVLLLSGTREASLAAAGIISGFHEPSGIAGDLGGGSLELVDIDKGAMRDATTLPLGGLRLLQRAGGNLEKGARLVDQDLAGVAWLKRGSGRTFFAVGGTWRNIAKLHIEHTGYPLNEVHGYSLSPKELDQFCDRLLRGRKVAGLEFLPPQRREVLPGGALVMQRVIDKVRPSEIVFSLYGIREGLLHTLLPASERRCDALIAFCDDYATLRSRSPEHARELMRWTDQIFVAPGPSETPEERRLRHAACLISDIAWRAQPDYRGLQSLNVIAHSAFAAIDHPGRVFLALTVCFRHTGGAKDDVSEELIALVSKGQLKRARLLGAAIRAIHMLSAGAPGVIGRTPLTYEGSRIVLTIPPDLMVLYGERLRKRFAVFAELLGFKPEIRAGE